MDSIRKKSFFKHFWVVLSGVVIIGFGAIYVSDLIKKDKEQNGAVNKLVTYQESAPEQSDEKKDKDFESVGETKIFTQQELTTTNLALSQGIQIDDPQSDWLKVAEGTTQPDGKEDNSKPYPLGWTDLKSLSMGSDAEYLYVKYTFWDNFPDEAFSYNGDVMDTLVAKLNSFTFVGSEVNSDMADLISNMSLRIDSSEKIVGIDHIAMISPSGKDQNQKTIFKTYSKDGLIAGGPGMDYLLSAFPLSQFNLQIGDTVAFDCSTEIGSEKYHHEAIDILLSSGGSKFGETIEYVLGSSTYTSTMPDYK